MFSNLTRSIALFGLLLGGTAADAAQELSGQNTCQPGTGSVSLVAPPPAPLPELTAANPDVQRKLDRRGTINLFGPWVETGRHPASDYGLTWHSWDEAPAGNSIWLKEMYWAYFYDRPDSRKAAYRFHVPELDSFLEPERWEHDPEYGSTYRIAYRTPGFVEYSAEVADRMLKGTGAEGLMFDWWIDNHPKMDRSEVQSIRQAMAKAIRAKVGDEPILLGNVGREKEVATMGQLNGVFMEYWKKVPADGYDCPDLLRMEELITYYDEALQQPKIVAFEPWRISQTKGDQDRRSPVNQYLAKLFSAMASVAPRNGYILYTDNQRDTDASDHEHVRYDFYKTDLGRAVSGRTIIAPGISYKRFEKGVAIYNISRQNAVVDFGGNTIEVRSVEGLFCKERKDGFDCI